MSVGDLDEALGFWRRFCDVQPRWRTVLDRPYLGRHVGYPGVQIDAAWLELPGGPVLELLEYQLPDKRPNPDATSSPGNVHVCLASDDVAALWKRAVASGARPIVAEGPVEIDAGPNRGGRAAYLRIHDGITLELIQPAGIERTVGPDVVS